MTHSHFIPIIVAASVIVISVTTAQGASEAQSPTAVQTVAF